jgi:hypothetical protein
LVYRLYGHLKYFTAIWYILWPFGSLLVIWYIFPALAYCVTKNLATLELSRRYDHAFDFVGLVCSSLDSTIHLWDVEEGVKLRPIENGPMECW